MSDTFDPPRPAPADRMPTILHIDDRDDHLYVVRKTLERAGYRVLNERTGEGGLAAAVATLPDLIILDIKLPDVSGIEVCRRIKADLRLQTTPVLHLSSHYRTTEDKAFALESGADAYLVHPAEPVELLATIHVLMRIRRTEDSLRENQTRLKIAVAESQARERLLRISDDRFSQALEAGQMGVWSWSLATGELYWSERTEVMNGYEPGTPRRTMHEWLDRIHPEDAPRVRDAIERSVERQMTYEDEFRLVLPDGVIRWIFTRGATRTDADGRVAEMYGVCLDVTARRAAEEALKESERRARAASEQAVRASRMKDDFLATLSHELRTPLNAIVGNAELLEIEEPGGAEFCECVHAIRRNAASQSQLIDDLLDVSRIITGKLTLEPRLVDLAEVLDAALGSVRLAAEAKGVALRVEAVDGSQAYGDAARLQQVLWNLLSNAIKFTPRGGRVLVRLTRQSGRMTVDVIDDGQGIDPQFLPYVFERFRQEDQSRARHYGGLGLGLAIARHIVEMHGGTIEADSAGRDRGSRFSVSLPIAPVLADPAGATSAAQRARDGDGTVRVPLGGLRVLVVDDHADGRSVVSRLLNRSGAETTEASSAAEAMSELKRRPFDLLICDLGMPDEDGLTLIRRIRSATGTMARVPAIALTAYAHPADRVESARAGFQAHLAKPVHVRELLETAVDLTGGAP
jgi:PAS domain S-box-containing protein